MGDAVFVPFHQRCDDEGGPGGGISGKSVQCENGSLVCVGTGNDATDGKVFVRLEKPIADGTRSLLEFWLSGEAADALCFLLRTVQRATTIAFTQESTDGR